jgi:glutamate formiminotransferase
VLEAVINISEGRNARVVDTIAAAAGECLLDVHRDEHHHRSVLTLAGRGVEDAARAVAEETVARVDLRGHAGVHPRLGAIDVVPFVPLTGTPMAAAVRARDAFARWAGACLGLPCFLYGPGRTLPHVRRAAFVDLQPDTGPSRPHPSAGAAAVGARPVLVAYNVWLDTPDLDLARRIAAAVRGPAIRALGLRTGDRVQVSLNLVAPLSVGPDIAHDTVAGLARDAGVGIHRAELVGLLPASVLERVAAERWQSLDLDASRTIEARLKNSA